MVQRNHSGSATKPVLIAIVSTIAVCGVCLTVYNQYVVEPRILASSNSGRSVSVESKQQGHAASEANYPQQCEDNTARVAALVRALAAARNAKDDSTEEPEAVEGAPHPLDVSTEEAFRSADEVLAVQQANMDILEKQLSGEPVDVDWATETEEIVANAFAALEDSVELEEVTCRTTFCRAQMTHDDPQKRSVDIDRLLVNRELTHQMVSYVPQGEEGRTVMYFAREGHTLSVLSPHSHDIQ